MTGRKLSSYGAGDGIEDRSAELLSWHREVFGAGPTSTKENSNGHLVINDPPKIDNARLESLFQARPKAREVFEGRHGKPSQSEADLALANYATAASWTAQQTCDLLVGARHNAGEPIKPLDYFERTIAKARDGTNSAPSNDMVPTGMAGFAKSIAGMRPGMDDITIGGDHGEETPGAASMADVAKVVEGVKYLVRDWIPFSMVTMPLGEPGCGKSAFALGSLARSIITPCAWFNGMAGPGDPGDVLWCDTEGTAAITVQRIKDWGLTDDRIKVPFHDDPLLSVNLNHQGHLDRIEAVIGKHGIKLVVIDSLRGAHDGDENNSRVARVLQNLAKIAERTGAAIVIIHHTRKLSDDEDVTANSSRGSNAIHALVRAQLGIDRPDKQSAWCRLRMLKENLGLKPKPIGFRVTDEGLEFDKAPQRPQKETEKDRAEAWLKTNMEPGKWYKAGELEDEAKQDDISETALRRARSDLGIVKPNHLRRTKDGWEWNLPGDGKSAGKTPGEIVPS